MRRFTIDLIISLAPLAFGSAMYVLYRSKTILIFKLFGIIGVSSYIDGGRGFFKSAFPIGHGLLLYSVPEGTWAFSFFYMVLWIWRQNPFCLTALFSIFCTFLVIEGSEIAQLTFFPGTFDINDMICNTLGITLGGGAAYVRRNQA